MRANGFPICPLNNESEWAELVGGRRELGGGAWRLMRSRRRRKVERQISWMLKRRRAIDCT